MSESNEELTKDTTIANFATVQSEDDRQDTRNITCINLVLTKYKEKHAEIFVIVKE